MNGYRSIERHRASIHCPTLRTHAAKVSEARRTGRHARSPFKPHGVLRIPRRLRRKARANARSTSRVAMRRGRTTERKAGGFIAGGAWVGGDFPKNVSSYQRATLVRFFCARPTSLAPFLTREGAGPGRWAFGVCSHQPPIAPFAGGLGDYHAGPPTLGGPTRTSGGLNLARTGLNRSSRADPSPFPLLGKGGKPPEFARDTPCGRPAGSVPGERPIDRNRTCICGLGNHCIDQLYNDWPGDAPRPFPRGRGGAVPSTPRTRRGLGAPGGTPLGPL